MEAIMKRGNKKKKKMKTVKSLKMNISSEERQLFN